MTPVEGSCAPGFDAVAERLESVVADGLTVGASLSVRRADGAPLVDLRAGHEDAERRRPWRADALAPIWSVSKSVSAVVIGWLIERDVLSLRRPIAADWPAFGANGKEAITLGDVLSHRSGVPGVSRPMTGADLEDGTVFAEALTREPPLWPPGADAAYHPRSGGVILNEVVRRAAGRSLGTVLREEIAEPLGLALHIGVPEPADHRVVETIGGPGLMAERAERVVRRPEARDAYFNPPLSPDQPNQRAWRAAEIPSVNGFGTADALADFFTRLIRLRGARPLRPETIADLTAERFNGLDRLLGTPLRVSAGFMLNDAERVFGPSPRAFGHTGWGGAFGFADPDFGIAVGFVPNLMLPDGPELVRRRRRLLDAIYAPLIGAA